jgi:uncharacterized protein (TIGR00369 family)
VPDKDRDSSSKKLQARHCFVCGWDNPRGLNLPYYYDGTRVTTEFIPDKELCGFDGIVHGGIIFSLADEAMMHLIWASELRAITAEVTIRYHGYAEINQKIDVVAEFEDIGRRLIRAKCILMDYRGSKIATARGKFLPFSKDDAMIFKKQF